jgi:hypothetical protein
MAAPEWAELDSLTQSIADLRVHQEAAKSVESHDLAATIEGEIAQLEERRNQLLAQLAQGVVKTEEPQEDKSGASHVAAETQRTERASIVWEQLTPADVERAKHDINLRRTEMLERHAAELKGLEADQADVDAVEQAIGAFIRKFGLPSAEVVPLNPSERNARQRTGR